MVTYSEFRTLYLKKQGYEPNWMTKCGKAWQAYKAEHPAQFKASSKPKRSTKPKKKATSKPKRKAVSKPKKKAASKPRRR